MQLDDHRTAGTRTLLPTDDPALAWNALEVAELAGWLLASGDAKLLCCAYDAGRPEDGVVVLSWQDGGSAEFDIRAVLAPGRCVYPPILTGLRRSARAILDALTIRWPSDARPTRIGLITDGLGVAFAPADPWPLVPGWLDRHLGRSGGGGDGLTHILPFDARGG